MAVRIYVLIKNPAILPMSQLPAQISSIPNQTKLATIQRLRKLSRLLDNAIAIPGTKFRVGLDPILGLLPGVGDFVGTALSTYILIEAIRIGVPRATLGKMTFNIIIESAVGAVPVLGDLFDFAWKANTQNMELLEAHLNIPKESEKANRWFIFLLLAGLLIIGIGLATFTVLVLKLLINVLNG